MLFFELRPYYIMNKILFLDWILKKSDTLIAVGALLFSFLAFKRSGKANQIAEHANAIAENANTLTTLAIAHSKDHVKITTMQSIVDKISKDWGHARQILIAEWRIHREIGVSIGDFNKIWEVATHRIKGRAPKESAKEILKEHL